MNWYNKNDWNDWSDQNDRLIKIIANKHGSLAWMHKKSAERSESLNTYIGIVVAVGVYITEAVSLLCFLSEPDRLKSVIITCNILGVAIGVMKTANLFLKEFKRAGKHRWSSGQHFRLFKDIEYELTKPVRKREKWRRFYKKICNVELELQSNSPEIPRRSISQYYSEWGNNALKITTLFQSQYMLAKKFSEIEQISLEKKPKDHDIENSASLQRECKKDARVMARRKSIAYEQIQFFIE